MWFMRYFTELQNRRSQVVLIRVALRKHSAKNILGSSGCAQRQRLEQRLLVYGVVHAVAAYQQPVAGFRTYRRPCGVRLDIHSAAHELRQRIPLGILRSLLERKFPADDPVKKGAHVIAVLGEPGQDSPALHVHAAVAYRADMHPGAV